MSATPSFLLFAGRDDLLLLPVQTSSDFLLGQEKASLTLLFLISCTLKHSSRCLFMSPSTSFEHTGHDTVEVTPSAPEEEDTALAPANGTKEEDATPPWHEGPTLTALFSPCPTDLRPPASSPPPMHAPLASLSPSAAAFNLLLSLFRLLSSRTGLCHYRQGGVKAWGVCRNGLCSHRSVQCAVCAEKFVAAENFDCSVNIYFTHPK